MIWGFRNLDRYGGSEDSRRDCCVKRSRAGCKATQAGEATKFVTFWWALDAGFGRRCIARPGRNRLMQQCPSEYPDLLAAAIRDIAIHHGVGTTIANTTP